MNFFQGGIQNLRKFNNKKIDQTFDYIGHSKLTQNFMKYFKTGESVKNEEALEVIC